MPTTKNRLLLWMVVFLVGFGAGIVMWQSVIGRRLASEHHALQTQLDDSVAGAETNGVPGAELISVEELERLRQGQRELLRLRAEVSALQNGVSEARTVVTNGRPDKLPEAVANTDDGLFHTNSVNVTARLDWEQTLVTGGWKTPEGRRTFFFFQPHRQPESDAVRMHARSFEVPENVLITLGLDSLRGDSTDAAAKNFFILESGKSLLDKLDNFRNVGSQKARHVDWFFDKTLTSANRQPGQIALTFVHTDLNGVPYFAHNGIDWVPTISSDGRSVELTLSVQLHPFLPPYR